MADRSIDDKASDTLVAGLRLMVLDEEFDPPPSPPKKHSTRRSPGAFFVGRPSVRDRHASITARRLRRSCGRRYAPPLTVPVNYNEKGTSVSRSLTACLVLAAS